MSNNNNTLSKIIRELIKKYKKKIDYNTLADALNISIQSFRNKINRNSFSIADLSIICYMIESKLLIQTDDSEIQITPELFLSEDGLKRLIDIKSHENEKAINAFKELAKTLDSKTLENIINDIKNN